MAGGLFNPGLVVAALGAVLVIFCVAQLFNPILVRVEDKAWLDNMAASRAGMPVPAPAQVEEDVIREAQMITRTGEAAGTE